jgi:hypothetical protein
MVSGRLYPTSDKVSARMIDCGVWVGLGVGIDVGAEVGEGVCVDASVIVGTVVAVCAWVAVSICTKWVVGTPVGTRGVQAVVITMTRKMVVIKSRTLLVVSVIQLTIFF